VRSGLIPWESATRRRSKFRAYWHTAWAVTWTPRRVASAVAWPLGTRAAVSFRRHTILLAGVSFALTLGLLACLPRFPSVSISPDELPSPWPLIFELWPGYRHLLITSLGAIAGFFIAADGISLAFRAALTGPDPGGERARTAVALSHYIVAPLAWLFVALLIALLFTLVREFAHVTNGRAIRVQPLYRTITILWAATGLWTWVAALRMLRPVTGCGVRHFVVTAVLILAWLIFVMLMCTVGVNVLVEAVMLLRRFA
jgi:hypothetical protein